MNLEFVKLAHLVYLIPLESEKGWKFFLQALWMSISNSCDQRMQNHKCYTASFEDHYGKEAREGRTQLKDLTHLSFK
jgi:hypothetical protein